MPFGGIIRFSEVLKASSDYSHISNGCLVDTSILFAGSFDLDQFNTEAVEIFDFLGEINVPLFANVNIRAEFIDLHRRVMIPEGLASLFAIEGKTLPTELYTQLQSVYSKLNKAKTDGRSYKFNEDNVSEWRRRLRGYEGKDRDGWRMFCQSFLQGKIENIWDEVCELLKINFISLRGGENAEWLENNLSWEDMASIVGEYGIGSFDAMIINLFLNSHFSALITSDKEIAYVLAQIQPENKFVVVPDKLII